MVPAEAAGTGACFIAGGKDPGEWPLWLARLVFRAKREKAGFSWRPGIAPRRLHEA